MCERAQFNLTSALARTWLYFSSFSSLFTTDSLSRSTMLSCKTITVLSAIACYLLSHQPVSARILNKCQAAKELATAGVDRTFISNFVCVMQNDGQFNTDLKKGPGHKASYSYGIFQISSDEWCSAFRPGGICNKNCNDFLDDNIQDDIVCAQKIFNLRGLKYWKGWMKKCKNGGLPNLTTCKYVSGAEKLNTLGDVKVGRFIRPRMINSKSVNELKNKQA